MTLEVSLVFTLRALYGLYDAVCHFNNGSRSTPDSLREAGIKPGHHALLAGRTSDRYRVKKTQRHSTDEEKQLRKNRRAATKAKQEFVAANEGPSYEPGGF